MHKIRSFKVELEKFFQLYLFFFSILNNDGKMNKMQLVYSFAR